MQGCSSVQRGCLVLDVGTSSRPRLLNFNSQLYGSSTGFGTTCRDSRSNAAVAPGPVYSHSLRSERLLRRWLAATTLLRRMRCSQPHTRA